MRGSREQGAGSRIPIAILFFAISTGVFAQETTTTEAVERGELSGLPAIDFTSYEGPHTRIDTRAQIREIGAALGRAVRAGAVNAGSPSRYAVLHVVRSDAQKLDADVMTLGANAGVDHIRNLRLIIQGYLETAYDYSAADASTLATYITVYNAVHRGDTAFFASRYHEDALVSVTDANAGLATNWSEWAGASRLVIPLATARPGELSALDTSAISGDEVVDRMREEDDRSIPVRQDMTLLKEREADEALARAEDLREQAAAAREKEAENKGQVTESGEQGTESGESGTASGEQGSDSGDSSNSGSGERGEGTGAEDLASGEGTEQGTEDAGQSSDAGDLASENSGQGTGAGNSEAQMLEAQAKAEEERAAQKTAEAQKERDTIAADQQAQIRGEGGKAPASAAKTGPVNAVLAMKVQGGESTNVTFLLLEAGTNRELDPGSVGIVQVKDIGGGLYVFGADAAAEIQLLQNPGSISVEPK